MKRNMRVTAAGIAVFALGLLCPVVPTGAPPLFGASAFQAKDQKLRRYPLRGVVRALVKDERLAMIKHQEVPGWMPAMTMEFEIRSSEEFRKLTKGMAITATVVVNAKGAYWLEDVRVVADKPTEKR